MGKNLAWSDRGGISYSDPSGYNLFVIVAGGAVVEIGVGDALAAVGAGAIGAALSSNGSHLLSQLGSLVGIGSSQASGKSPEPQAGSAPTRENGTNPADDKKASPSEVKGIEKLTGEPIESTKTGGKNAGGADVFRDTKRDYHVKPKDNSGPGEPLSINGKDLPR